MLKWLIKNKEKLLIILFILVLSFIILMQNPLNIFSKSFISATDSSVFRTVAHYMSKGLMPYKDIFDHKGPLIYIINYFGMLISYNKGIWFLELISMFITLIFMYKTSRLYCNSFFSILVLLLVCSGFFIYFDQGNLTEEYALPFIALSLYIFLDYFKNKKISKFRLILCGISFGSVCLLRVNMISLWIVFCLLVVIDRIKNKKVKDLINYILYFTIGFLIVLLPIVIWLALNNSLDDFFKEYIIFNLKYSSDPNRSSLLNRLNSLNCFVNNPLSLMSIFICVFICYKNKTLINVGYLFCLLLTFFLMSISGQTYAHYGMMLLPLMIFPFSIILNNKNVDYFIPMFMLFMVIVSLPSWFNGIKDIISRNNLTVQKDELIEYKIANDIRLNSSSTDKITVFGNMDIIYILSDRLSSSKYTYQTPIIYIDNNIENEYFKEISINKPKIIVKTAENELLNSFIIINNYEKISSYNDDKIIVFKRTVNN